MKFLPTMISINKINFLLTIIVCMGNIAAVAQSEIQNVKPINIGESFEIYSKELGENRIINVYLPDGFHRDSQQQYHVFYLLDGSVDEDFLHVVGLVQFAAFPWVNYVPPSIVVGIANVDRKRDFTFPSSVEVEKLDFPTTGGSEKFIKFLEKELIPTIDKNFPVDSNRTIIGQSLGGLVATEILSSRPQLFQNYILVSPSLWWSNRELLHDFPTVSSSKRIYLAVGEEGSKMVEDCTKFNEILQPLHQTHFEYFEDANHGNILHLALYEALQKLFTVN